MPFIFFVYVGKLISSIDVTGENFKVQWKKTFVGSFKFIIK